MLTSQWDLAASAGTPHMRSATGCSAPEGLPPSRLLLGYYSAATRLRRAVPRPATGAHAARRGVRFETPSQPSTHKSLPQHFF